MENGRAPGQPSAGLKLLKNLEQADDAEVFPHG